MKRGFFPWETAEYANVELRVRGLLDSLYVQFDQSSGVARERWLTELLLQTRDLNEYLWFRTINHSTGVDSLAYAVRDRNKCRLPNTSDPILPISASAPHSSSCLSNKSVRRIDISSVWQCEDLRWSRSAETRRGKSTPCLMHRSRTYRRTGSLCIRIKGKQFKRGTDRSRHLDFINFNPDRLGLMLSLALVEEAHEFVEVISWLPSSRV